MGSSGKKKTTMAKLAREGRLRERRVEKEARKQARRYLAEHPPHPGEEYGALGEDSAAEGQPQDGALDADPADPDREAAARTGP